MDVPVFLHGYEPFMELEKWRHETPASDPKPRRWMIEVNEQLMFACELLWHDGGENVGVWMVKYARNIHEAVFASLDAFKRGEKNFDDPNGSSR